MASPYSSINPTQFLFVFFLLFATALLIRGSSACHPDDRMALIDIDKSLHNAFTDNDLWNLTIDCCQWYGVQCDGNRVVEFHLNGDMPEKNAEFTGPIPDAIGRLTYLRRLIIRFMKKMSGRIPPSMASLTHLDVLLISNTRVSGPIPDWIGRFTDLTSLDLSFSSFSGPIPASLGYLPKIVDMQLNWNKLSGPIPDSFGRFPGTIPSLSLNNNLLTSVPKSMGGLDFEHLWLQHNLLQGDASHLLKNRSASLKFLDLSSNRLEFDLSRVVFPLKLEYVNLGSNRIYGTIPRGIVDVSGLTRFDVNSNRLCGPIPQGGPMSRFSKSSYAHNKCLCGAPLTNKC